MPSRPLLANDSFRKECLSISSFFLLIPTCLKSLTGNTQDDCCKFVFGFVTLFTKHELYKACSFESGSENSFERMCNYIFACVTI